MLAHDRHVDTVYRDAACEGIVRKWPQMLGTIVKGHGSEAMVHFYIREFHAYVNAATKRFDICHDWSALTGFDPEARRVFLKWGRDRNAFNRRVCRGVHVLVESTVVFLALEAAAAFTQGYFIAYRQRRTFELERDRLLRSPSTESI